MRIRNERSGRAWRALTLAGGLALASQAAALAAAVTYEHIPERTTDHVSVHRIGGPVLADDFDPAIGAAGLVTFVEWWGSAAPSSLWEVTLHRGSGTVPAVPAAIPASTGGTKYFVAAAGTPVPPGPGVGPGLFHFSAALPGDFFVTQQPDLTQDYWFSVANAENGWTWALAGAGPTVGDEHWHAVRSVGSAPCGDGGPHCGAWTEIEGFDFAFRITVSEVPAPASLALLGGGLAALVLGARRRTA